MNLGRAAGIAMVLAFHLTGCVAMLPSGSRSFGGSSLGPQERGFGTGNTRGVESAYQHGPDYLIQGRDAGLARFDDRLGTAPAQAPIVGLHRRYSAVPGLDHQPSRRWVIINEPTVVAFMENPESPPILEWDGLSSLFESSPTDQNVQPSRVAVYVSEDASVFIGIRLFERHRLRSPLVVLR